MRFLIVLLAVLAIAFFVFTQWSWVFSKKVQGRVLAVSRVTQPNAILGSRITDAQMHSYSIMIQGDDGKIYNASSEDRQWEVVTKDYCVTTRLYVYPPWELEKAGTYFNARILETRFCSGQPPVTPPPTEPVTNELPQVPGPPPEVK